MCTGTIKSLDGQTVTLTGKVSIRGRWVKREEIEKGLKDRGVQYKREMSKLVTILVHGDLEGQHVINEFDKYSQRLEFVRSQLNKGHHICVVNSRGLSALLEATTAECQTWKFEQTRV